MTLVVLVILAALWAVVLLPPLLRSRSRRANDSIGDFNYRLDALGRTNGALRPGVPTRATPGARAAKRRRDVLRLLMAIFVLTAISALVTNRKVAWAAFGLAAVALAAFGALWAYARSIQIEQSRKVRAIPQQRVRELALRRAASS